MLAELTVAVDSHRPTHPPVQWVPGSFPRGKIA